MKDSLNGQRAACASIYSPALPSGPGMRRSNHSQRGSQKIMPATQKILVLVLAGLLFFSVSACNTIKGFGKDVERTGETIQDVAK